MEDEKKFLNRMKKTFYREGFALMIHSTIVLVGMFVICMDSSGGIRFFPEKLFWMIQIFVSFGFVVGAAGYLLSLTIKTETEE